MLFLDLPINIHIILFSISCKMSSEGNKRLSVERIYQKKTQREHILLRPDTYIGSVQPNLEAMWVYDEGETGMNHREITYVPGFYKIFDEIMGNAADNKQRDANMDVIKIEINTENREPRKISYPSTTTAGASLWSFTRSRTCTFPP